MECVSYAKLQLAACFAHHHATASYTKKCEVICVCNYLLQLRPGLGVRCARSLHFSIPRTQTDWLQ